MSKGMKIAMLGAVAAVGGVYVLDLLPASTVGWVGDSRFKAALVAGGSGAVAAFVGNMLIKA